MGTWEEPLQEIWQPFIADGVKAFVSTANFSTTSTLTSTQIVKAQLLIDSAMTFVMDTSRIRNSEANFASSSTFTANVTQTFASNTNLPAISTFTADTIVVSLTTVGMNAVSTFVSTPKRAQNSNLNVTSTAQSTFTPTVRVPLQFQAECTFSSSPVKGELGTVNFAAISSISIQPNHIERVTLTPNAVTTFNAAGGSILQSTLQMQGFAATLFLGEIFKIDPERILTILSEIRSLQITQETRLFDLNTETRINIIAQETRSRQILNETRNLVVQHNLLIDVAGTPRDRREG
jgi:hypothetical protein